MNRQEVLEKLIRIFSTMTESEEITEESDLGDDLGISSMDLLTLISYIEEEFHIQISERSIRDIVTVSDVVDVVLEILRGSSEDASATAKSPFSFFKGK